MATQDIVETIAKRCIDAASGWAGYQDRVTPGRAQAFLLQHLIRNRLFSAVFRPAWMSRCPDQAIVRKTIGQMLEELVHDPAIKVPHTKLLKDMGRALGLSDTQMEEPVAMPATDLGFNVMENLSRTRHWIVGWLTTSIEEFVLVELKGDCFFNADKWKRELGLTEEQIYCMRYHEQADMEHAGTRVWEPIRKHVTTPQLRDEVLRGLDTALAANGLFYEGTYELGELLDAQGAQVAAA